VTGVPGDECEACHIVPNSRPDVSQIDGPVLSMTHRLRSRPVTLALAVRSHLGARTKLEQIPGLGRSSSGFIFA
jgi:hypothetical protein